MSRVGALVVAAVVAAVGFVAGWLLLASAAEPELREPIVVEEPGTGATRPPPTTAPAAPDPSTPRPSIVPPPTVGPTGPPLVDDDGDDGADSSDDGSNDGEDMENEGGGGDG